MTQIASRSGPAIRALALALVASFTLIMATATATAEEIDRFVGEYTGSAEIVNADGSSAPRDMSVWIESTGKGFSVKWSTITYRADGDSKEKVYEIFFVPSDRDGVFSAAMKKNVFGHEVQLDPMKGEPYVWARIIYDTLTVYSLFVDEDGGYELQQFDRTLAEGGLKLDFARVSNGMKKRTTSAFLERQD